MREFHSISLKLDSYALFDLHLTQLFVKLSNMLVITLKASHVRLSNPNHPVGFNQ